MTHEGTAAMSEGPALPTTLVRIEHCAPCH
jgi:hypothetical protein